jgi:hypothetical protein
MWQRPLAYAIRKRDRGRFVRSQAAFEALLPEFPRWSLKRGLYAYNGLEIIICWLMKS